MNLSCGEFLPLIKNMKKKIKEAYHGVTSFVEYCINELIAPQSEKRCVRCHKHCDTGYFVLEGHNLRLCSEKCYKEMYERFEKYQEAIGEGDK